MTRGLKDVGEVAKILEPEISSLCGDPPLRSPASLMVYFPGSQGAGLCLPRHHPTLKVGCIFPKCGAGVLDLGGCPGSYGFCTPFIRVSSTPVPFTPVAPFRVCTLQVSGPPPGVRTEAPALANAGPGPCRRVAVWECSVATTASPRRNED